MCFKHLWTYWNRLGPVGSGLNHLEPVWSFGTSLVLQQSRWQWHSHFLRWLHKGKRIRAGTSPAQQSILPPFWCWLSYSNLMPVMLEMMEWPSFISLRCWKDYTDQPPGSWSAPRIGQSPKSSGICFLCLSFHPVISFDPPYSHHPFLTENANGRYIRHFTVINFIPVLYFFLLLYISVSSPLYEWVLIFKYNTSNSFCMLLTASLFINFTFFFRSQEHLTQFFLEISLKYAN